ncbi:HNH endonuclease [Sphingopyxis sp. LARHCG72]
MKHFLAAGMPPEAIIAAVAEMEESMHAALAEMVPERSKAAERQARYRQRGGGQVPDDVRQEVFRRDGYQCCECRSDDRLEIDHIIPLNKGGHPTDIENLQTLCRPCNARKRDRIRKADNRGKLQTNAELAGKSEGTGGNPRTIADTGPLPLPPNDNNSNPPTPTPENNTPRVREAADGHVTDWLAWREKNPFPKPYFSRPQPWADFLKNRKEKRQPNTVTAHDKMLRDVAKIAARTGWPPGRVFLACVEEGWAGIYETNEMKAAINANGNGGNQRSARQSLGGQRDNRDGFKRACDDWIDEAQRSATGGDGGSRQLALGGPGSL